MSNNRFEGVIHKMQAEQTFGSGFRKREMILSPDSSSDKRMKFVFLGDEACDSATVLTEGERVTVHFTLDGREWYSERKQETLFFTDLIVRDIEVVGSPDRLQKLSEPAPEPGDEIPF